MKKTIVSREDAKRELLENSHLNVIQIEKLLGSRETVERAIVDLALQISRDAEKAAEGARQPVIKAMRVEPGKKMVPLGSSRNVRRSQRAQNKRLPMTKGIKKAISFVDSEALM
ncbi:hypothetical protein A8B78_08035 [Jannaschia sp. EhC01]|nr:hypothetical protein A8B78_08035 [Jannaschia sp. EhC01]